MVERVFIFIGSKKDFTKYLSENIDDDDEIVPFMEMIQDYNSKLRPPNTAYDDNERRHKRYVENCVVKSDDYSSVLEHVVSNFVNIVTLNHDINKLFVHNPPKRVYDSLVSNYSDIIEIEYTSYFEIDRNKIIEIRDFLKTDIVGQISAKRKLLSSLYRISNSNNNKPAVVLMYGPSGVGKTESAKCISKALGGELLRIQFSMMQTVAAFDYIFGSSHSQNSFARDLLNRETNLILIDEFDKVNPSLYNAFYEVFDEGRYVDTNYSVDLIDSIFVLTTNFSSEKEARETLGMPIFSRVGTCICYHELENCEKEIILKRHYNETLENLKQDEKEIILQANIFSWFKENISRFNNIRMLKNNIENAIYDIIVDELILK